MITFLLHRSKTFVFGCRKCFLSYLFNVSTIEPNIILRILLGRFQVAVGKVIERTFEDLKERSISS